ncbi:hypothetical protein [[Collinsella] massiliensis]|uniref:Uncharacterized protein n=1 Tax=[Collinsella] massiliensis TaxID=1232426 RepID=A0A1Y3XTQ4_9ACTN|nr:hypothetical protein [[Collinsella] massiliensis]OUN88511.1 hypothetical protein B5G02_06250 [[Collinsella] massiliensis]
MVVLDKEKVERSNWLDYDRPRTAREHRGYWYDPTDPAAFHTPGEIDDHIARARVANDIDVFRRNPDMLAQLKARVAEHPEERAGWKHVLDVL